ncbi:hypothetical protein J6590_084414 [Homalodisca vitripennis]|nr:hypothetical protein J6590_084414 [Homalodisca vitripennis]
MCNSSKSDTTDHSDERVTDMAIRRDPDRYAADMVGEKYVGDITDYSGGHVIDMAARRDWGWIRDLHDTNLQYNK